MDIIERNFYRLLRAGAFGTEEQLEPLSAWKWNRLYQLSEMHDVSPIIYKGIECLHGQFFLQIPEELSATWRAAVENRTDSDTDVEGENDLLARYERGEYFSQGRIPQEGEQYQTSIGRIVYGGGGITPDFFVPEDTTTITSYYREAVFTGLIHQFAFAYADANRAKLTSLRTVDRMEQYLRKENLLEKFAQFGEKHQLRRRNLMLQKSRRLFERSIYGNIINYVGEMKDYLMFIGKDDPVVIKAQEILEQGLSFPQAPETDN